MKTILVVDDSKENQIIIRAFLQDIYNVVLASSGALALEYLSEKHADLALLDVQMTQMNGIELAKKIRNDARLKNMPLLFLTGVESADMEVKCLEEGGDDYIRKPCDRTVLRSRIAKLLELYELRYNLEFALHEKERQLDRMVLSTIITIANIVDAKDSYTGGHSLRVAVCARDIADNLGWSSEEIQNVYNVALLHDIGKIAVKDEILNKPGRLTDEEFEMIKEHPVIGNKILKDITVLPHVREGAHYHHERWDGKGYPDGLSGENIPIYARIIAVADAYDAMRSDRVYRKHLSKEKIIFEVERGRGSQFDPELADLFVFMLRGGYDVDPELIRNSESDSLTAADNDENAAERRSIPEMSVDNETDMLTGLFNRSYVGMKVGSRIMKDRCGTFMIIDMDRFKLVNEKFGHLEGDRILKEFAVMLNSFFRDEDIVSRMGGDDFAVFISGKPDREMARYKAQSIIDALRNSELSKQHDRMLSVSIGISICPDNGITFEELYSSADKALYHGSRSGFSMYHFYGSEEKVDAADNTDEDMKLIKGMIEGRFGQEDGALSVKYDDFQNIYNYVYRYVDRNDTDVQIILFTITPTAGGVELSVLEQLMHNLDIAVVESLRRVDVGTRYSSNQYIVILTDTDIENGSMVAGRVAKRFYRLSGDGIVTLRYDIDTLKTKKAE